MSAREAAEYFRQRPLGRVLERLRNRYIELGRAGGTVSLESPTQEELSALRAFLSDPLKRQGDGAVVLSLGAFEAELHQGSRFECTLREALEAYFDAPLVTKREARETEQQSWEDFVARVTAEVSPQLHAFVTGLKGEWRQDASLLERALRVVFQALAELPGPAGNSERLAVFANRIAGDPHTFDPDRQAGRLLVRALSHLFPGTIPDLDTEAGWRELILAHVGLDRDDVSSTVTVIGVQGDNTLLRAAFDSRQVLAYPLRTVRRLHRVKAHGQRVFVVENPAVFGALVDELDAAYTGDSWPCLVCTSGQLSAASSILLSKLVAGGAHLFYSGDFDVGGLRIARGLVRQYGSSLSLWRFDASAYARALDIGGRYLKEADLEILKEMADSFPDLVPCMQTQKLAAYQEALVSDLLSDILAWRRVVPNA